MSSGFVIYGANGYTGELIARAAAARGLRPVLAGRSRAPVEALAAELGLEARVFALDDPAAVDDGLRGNAAVLHCAGPFEHTSRPMADACLRVRAAYLDITGEVAVFEALAARDDEARQAGVLLLPGVGFDVVPTDCAAAYLKTRLPWADRLALAFRPHGRPSRGTATTVVENLHRGGLVRRGRELVPVPPGYKTRHFDFGRGPEPAACIPWGDVSTAFHSTGIPNVEVYLAAPWQVRTSLLALRPFAPLLRTAALRGFLKRRIQAGPRGPSTEERARGGTVVVGEAEDARGRRWAVRLRGPESYNFTVLAALRAVERVLAGDVNAPAAGFKTPSLAFGHEFVLEVSGVVRADV